MPDFRIYPVLFFLIPFACLSEIGSAQPAAERSVSAGTGIVFHSEINEIVSRLNYSGTALPVWLNYKNRTKNRIHQVALHFYTASLDNVNSSTRDVLFLELSYRLSFPLVRFTLIGQPIQLDAGPGLLNRGLKNEQFLSTPFITVNRHNNGHIISSFSGHLDLRTAAGSRHEISYSLESPLLLYYFGRDYSDTGYESSFLSVFDLVLLVQQLEYRYRLTEKLSLVSVLRYDMNRIENPNYYGGVYKNITLGAQWRF